jgi:hypothetical protein
VVALVQPYVLAPDLPLCPSLYLDKKKRKGETKRERKKEIGSRNTGIVKVLPFLPP